MIGRYQYAGIFPVFSYLRLRHCGRNDANVANVSLFIPVLHKLKTKKAKLCLKCGGQYSTLACVQ